MTDTLIIEELQKRLSIPSGRHLYGILGSYPALERFAHSLQQARKPDGKPFPVPVSLNRGILEEIPEEEFKELVENEPRRPEPTANHVKKAFEAYLRSLLGKQKLLVLTDLEILFTYNIELNLLRTLATDDKRIILLLPGYRQRGEVLLFPELVENTCTLPVNFIANNHMWELNE